MICNNLDIFKMNTEILFNPKLAIVNSETFFFGSILETLKITILHLDLHMLGDRIVFKLKAFKNTVSVNFDYYGLELEFCQSLSRSLLSDQFKFSLLSN